MKNTPNSYFGERQAFSQDLKTGCPKCVVRVCSNQQFITQNVKNKKVGIHIVPGHPSGYNPGGRCQ